MTADFLQAAADVHGDSEIKKKDGGDNTDLTTFLDLKQLLRRQHCSLCYETMQSLGP